MKTDKPVSAICPLCGKLYSGVPALSRTDNHLPGLRHSAGTGKHRRFQRGTGENPVCNAPKVPHVTALFALYGLSEHLPKKLPKVKISPTQANCAGLGWWLQFSEMPFPLYCILP